MPESTTRAVPRQLAARLGWATRRAMLNSGRGEAYDRAKSLLRHVLAEVKLFRDLTDWERRMV